jgi:hypothetical protein
MSLPCVKRCINCDELFDVYEDAFKDYSNAKLRTHCRKCR